MKKLIYLFAAGSMAFAACEQPGACKVSGVAEDIPDGDTVYLQRSEGRKLVRTDSAAVRGGSFAFTAQPDTAACYYLTYAKDGKHYVADFFPESGTVTAKLGPEPRVGGTPRNEAYQQCKDLFGAKQKEMTEIYQRMRNDSTLTDAGREALEAETEAKLGQLKEAIYKATRENITNVMGVRLFLSNVYREAYTLEQQKELLGLVPEALSGEDVESLKAHVETLERTAPGQPYVDFSLQTPEGETVNLSDFIGKNRYTLVDFWASWCGPCRQEMPNVVAAYEEFKSKGFGIVGVSLDNSADKWKEAIRTLGITWPQMSDLQGWNNAGSRLYGVNSIPATVLIDQNGVIVERDLRGDAIKAKLGELLQ